MIINYINRRFYISDGEIKCNSVINERENDLTPIADDYYENMISYRSADDKNILRFDCGYVFAPSGYKMNDGIHCGINVKYIQSGEVSLAGNNLRGEFTVSRAIFLQ